MGLAGGCAAALGGVLLVAWLGWRSPGRRMRRHRARAARLSADDYRKERRELSRGERPVTVAELVARAAAEQRAAMPGVRRTLVLENLDD